MKKKGFTLTKIIIVIAVLALVSVIMISSIVSYIKKEQDSKLKQELIAINEILEHETIDGNIDDINDVRRLLNDNNFNEKNYVIDSSVLVWNSASHKLEYIEISSEFYEEDNEFVAQIDKNTYYSIIPISKILDYYCLLLTSNTLELNDFELKCFELLSQYVIYYEYTTSSKYYQYNGYLNEIIVNDNHREKVRYIIIKDGNVIGDSAFKNFKNIIKVYNTTDITHILSYAFSNCTTLSDIDISNATKIYEYAFENCESLEMLELKTENIYNGTFQNCYKLKEVVFNNKVDQIYEEAFANCYSLTNVTFKIESELSVQKKAFYNCSNLKSLKTAKLISIEDESFKNCSKLEEIVLSDNLIKIGYHALYNTVIKTLQIPNNVQSISEEGLSNLLMLEELKMPNLESNNYDFIKVFGKSAHDMLYKIVRYDVEYYIPLTLKRLSITTGKINNNAFNDFLSLQEIELLNVTELGNYLFIGCSNLSCLTFPSCLEKIGKYTFFKVKSIDEFAEGYKVGNKDVGFRLEKLQINNIGLGQINLAVNNECLTVEKEGVVSAVLSTTNCNKIPDTVMEISDYAFALNSKMDTIEIGSNVKKIGNFAFAWSSATEFKFSPSVTYVGTNPLAFCTALNTITGESNSKYIIDGNMILTDLNGAISGSLSSDTVIATQFKEYSFAALGIKELKIGVDTLSYHLFYRYFILLNSFYMCYSIEKITDKNGEPLYGDDDCHVIYTLQDRHGGHIYEIYYSNPFTEMIFILPKVYKMDASEINFDYRSLNYMLEEIYKFDSYQKWLNSDEKEFIISNILFEVKQDVEEYIVPDGVLRINYEAFKKCVNLKKVIIPSSVEHIDERVFENLENLEEVIFEDNSNLQYIGSRYNVDNATSRYLFDVDSSHKLSFIHTEIPGDTFRGCINLKSITIPASVRQIGSYSFLRCMALESINFEEGSNLRSLSTCAFGRCASIEKIIVPSGVQVIPNYSFSGCTNLKSIIFEANQVALGIEAFRDCSSLCEINSENVIYFGRRVFTNCYSLKNIIIGEHSDTYVIVREKLWLDRFELVSNAKHIIIDGYDYLKYKNIIDLDKAKRILTYDIHDDLALDYIVDGLESDFTYNGDYIISCLFNCKLDLPNKDYCIKVRWDYNAKSADYVKKSESFEAILIDFE